MWTAWLVRGRNDMPSSLLADRGFAVAMLEYSSSMIYRRTVLREIRMEH